MSYLKNLIFSFRKCNVLPQLCNHWYNKVAVTASQLALDLNKNLVRLKKNSLQDSNHYVFEQKTFCNMRKGTPISIIDKMSCLLSPFVVSELFCLVMFRCFFLDP